MTYMTFLARNPRRYYIWNNKAVEPRQTGTVNVDRMHGLAGCPTEWKRPFRSPFTYSCIVNNE
jgi:hypothetical protein